MEIGIGIPHMGRLASASLVSSFCIAADRAGFDGLWTGDHVVAPVHTESKYTLAPEPTGIADGAVIATMGLNLEMNITLAVAAAVTTRAKLCTGVAVLPIRNPVLNARQIASIDLYSGGRVRYGVGVGWLKEEADAMAMPWDRRGARTDEHIELMRALWTAEGDTVEFAGEFNVLPPMGAEPRPSQRPIPILVGGHSSAAIDRVARLGDGWISTGMGKERLTRALGTLADACDRHGRDFDRLHIVGGQRHELDPGKGPLGPQIEQLASELLEFEDLGVHHMKFSIRTDDADALLEAVEQCGQELLPLIR